MGKTPKKAAPGGDERNLYVRRLKATTTASSSSSSKGCDTSLPARQHESDNSNRSKVVGRPNRVPLGVGKVFKSKLRSPARTKSHQAMKNPTRFQPSTSKDDKKLTSTTTAPASKDRETNVAEMHPESEESAVQLKVSIMKKDVNDGGKNSPIDEEISKNVTETCVSHSESNGKQVIDLTETENTTPQNDSEKQESVPEKNVEKSATEETQMIENRDNGNESSDTITIDVENETELANSEPDDALKLVDEGEPPKLPEINGVTEECTTNGQKETNEDERKESAKDNDELTKSTENCSVDVVESTTSEASDSGNVTQSDKEVEIGEQTKEGNNANDQSFISYDSNIMLKDVKIKLNDCLKDNSKLFEVSNIDESNTEQQKRLDMSFGKTLRNISGRSTINRLRYVTVREQRFSPNSSLFVNTSSASLDPEDPMSCKLIRYPTDISESIICNGSPADRKRKLVEDASALSKKAKTQSMERTSSLLNTSLEMLKSIRRPVQVSTPNTKGYKFDSDKLNFKGFGDEKLTIDSEVEPKKWCVVM